MIVLVTGASGWIGGRTARQLLRAGAEVRCLVEPGTDRARLPADADVVTGDVRDAEAVAAAMTEVEVVVHCAAVIHPVRAGLFREVNELGTRQVVQEAARAGARRLVYVSSNAAAGFQREREVPLTEDDPPRPRGGYGTSKLAAERAVLEAHEAGSLEATVVRPCRCYGPGQPPRVERVFRMIRTGTVPVFGDGGALRSMSFVDDVVRVLVQCLDDPRASGETFWIADERPYTTLEAFEAMAEAAGVPLRVRRVPEAAGRICEALDLALERAGRYSMSLHLAGEARHDIGCSVAKAKRSLGFEPRDDLVGGLRDALAASHAGEPLVAA